MAHTSKYIQSYTPTFSEWFTPILVGWCSISHHPCSLNEQHLICSGGDHYRGHTFVEDIPVTIVGIDQNSLINGPTNRSSLTACLHGGGGGANIVTFSRCMLGSSPVPFTHGQPMPTGSGKERSFGASPCDSSAQPQLSVS